MDKQFLEFWGNFLINAAKGQKQLEDMSKWIKQGSQGFDEITAMFSQYYGLEPIQKNTSAYSDAWESASEAFKKSFKDYLRMMDVVPQEEHLILIKKYEALKEKVASHEKTIKYLKMLLNGKTTQENISEGFQSVVEKQCEQFYKTMETIGYLFAKDNDLA
jgi:hypothetical protein